MILYYIRWLITFVFLSCCFIALQAVQLQLGLDYNFQGTYSSYHNGYQRTDSATSDCFSPVIQIMVPFLYTQIGLGVQYQTYKKINSNELSPSETEKAERFDFLPVYAVIQVPIHYQPFPFETYSELGYSLLQGNTAYRSYQVYNSVAEMYETRKATLSGSFHTGIGLGFVKPPLIYKIMFRCDHGFYNTDQTYKRNIENYCFSLGIEYRFKITNH